MFDWTLDCCICELESVRFGVTVAVLSVHGATIDRMWKFVFRISVRSHRRSWERAISIESIVVWMAMATVCAYDSVWWIVFTWNSKSTGFRWRKLLFVLAFLPSFPAKNWKPLQTAEDEVCFHVPRRVCVESNRIRLVSVHILNTRVEFDLPWAKPTAACNKNYRFICHVLMRPHDSIASRKRMHSSPHKTKRKHFFQNKKKIPLNVSLNVKTYDNTKFMAICSVCCVLCALLCSLFVGLAIRRRSAQHTLNRESM